MMEPSCLGFVFGAELSFSRAARGRSRCFWLVASRKAGGWRLRLTPVRRPVVSVSYFGTAGEIRATAMVCNTVHVVQIATGDNPTPAHARKGGLKGGKARTNEVIE